MHTLLQRCHLTSSTRSFGFSRRELETCVPAALFTSPQLSDRQDEECIEEQSSNTIYERQMLPKKRGSFPLWNPQPNAFAPLTHRRKGVLIGDLGRVTADGAFDVLFNICKAAGHPDNPDELPDGFTPLSLNANDIHGFQEYTSGDYIASASVTKLRLGSVHLARIICWLTN